MKYVQAKVPQQDNSHDCGLYVLNYIEAFLMEFTSPNFRFASSERGPHFTCPPFVVEVFSKRRHIQKLILELIGISQKRAKKCKARKILLEELLQTSKKLRVCLKDEGDVSSSVRDSIFSFEDSMYVQHHQPSGISRGNKFLLSGLEIEPAKYEDRCESLSPKQQHAKPEVEIVDLTNFNGPNFETKCASIHEDAIDVQHQQSSGISRLDYEPLDGLEHRHVEFQRATNNFLDKNQHHVFKELPWIDVSGALMGKNKRGRNMTQEETSVLLSCKLQRGRFCKGSGGATDWSLISEEIRKKLGSLPLADQCRLRYDTLLKAYKTYKKYCMKTGKTFSGITEAERLNLKLATTLSEEWYTSMDEICDKANVSQKRMKLSSNVVLDSACGTVALRNVIPTSVLSSLNEDLQSTLLNLVQECSLDQRVWNKKVFGLEKACRRLAILQDREPREILNYVLKLWELKLVNVVDMVFEEGNDLAHIDLWEDKTWFLNLRLYNKISKEVLCKNPHLKTYCTRFPIEQCSLRYIRVLILVGCSELEHLHLREFPSLQSLAMSNCPQFNLVTGWEAAVGLQSLHIWSCNAYDDFPNVQYLFSLREVWIRGKEFNKSVTPWQLSQFSQCAKLQRLEIWYDESLPEIVDLENLKELKFLEFLSLQGCSFSSIRGLSGLQALTTLDLHLCRSLRKVPDLGCLKGLTHLDMSDTGVEDVQGVEELHLLTFLDLCWCESLKWLPFLGHLKALVYLNLGQTCVKEIPGREGLINLKTLYWDLE